MEEPSKKDKLAKQRTDLANSRTLMSFIRTALMVAATGITFIKLFNDEVIPKIQSVNNDLEKAS